MLTRRYRLALCILALVVSAVGCSTTLGRPCATPSDCRDLLPASGDRQNLKCMWGHCRYCEPELDRCRKLE